MHVLNYKNILSDSNNFDLEEISSMIIGLTKLRHFAIYLGFFTYLIRNRNLAIGSLDPLAVAL